MMNRSREAAAGDGFCVSRRISNYFKDKDEELSFFRDLQKREKDQVASLLQPDSEEFEANGNYALCRMESGGRKGAVGLEYFLGDHSGKNDYNWLKTPPATPLFPSLEMETKGHPEQLIVQREIPIIQPLSRFAGNPEGSTMLTSANTLVHPKTKLPQRNKTALIASDKRNMKTAPVVTDQTAPTLPTKTKPSFLPSKTIAMEPNPKTRGVLPSIRPTNPSGAGFSDMRPPNLRTTSTRPASATRGRPLNPNLSTLQRKDLDLKVRRQSCSPSVARGRKVDVSGSTGNDQPTGAGTGRKQYGNKGQVVGSRMVERFMNARSGEERQSRIKMTSSMNENSSSGEERQASAAKIKLNGSLNESSSAGFGRLMSNNSLHMELQRDPSNGCSRHRVRSTRKS